MNSDFATAVASRTSRSVLMFLGMLALIATLVMASPASADTGFVKDVETDGGLQSMTVKRGPVLKVVTRFTKASDLHQFRITEPGRRKPTFTIKWRTDLAGNGAKYVEVRRARRTVDGGPKGRCRIARVDYAGVDAGRAARKMTFSVPNSCLWIDEQDIPLYRVDQRSFSVSDGIRTRTDRLGYTKNLNRKRPY